jgi:hypothetical protein
VVVAAATGWAFIVSDGLRPEVRPARYMANGGSWQDLGFDATQDASYARRNKGMSDIVRHGKALGVRSRGGGGALVDISVI